MIRDPAELSESLSRFISREGRFSKVSIENLRRMPGGASREIWSFDATLEAEGKTARRALVLRRDPGASRIDTNRREEFLVLRAAYQEKAPVPELLWISEDPPVLGPAFFLMERIEV